MLRKILLASAIAAAILAAGTAAASPTVSIRMEDGAFHVDGWKAPNEPAAGWGSMFAVYAGEGDVPALLGSYEVRDEALIFHPRFPITPGVRYHAVFQPSGMQRIEALFDGPPRATNPLTKVERIYPSTGTLPSNALRLYIYFSAPMSRGEAWQHIHLIDASTERPIEMPFLELEQELWDQNNQRLTVLFDPGRIKRGLVPTSELGPPVVDGKRYKLSVDADWHDARGVKLVEGFAKTFRGGPPDRIPPEPKTWRVSAPKAGTLEALVIAFPKPMDYVLLQRTIGVFDRNGELAGNIVVAKDETEWRFTPQRVWKSGSYTIKADNILEDISGNHLDRPFDVDVFENVTQHIATETTAIRFAVP